MPEPTRGQIRAQKAFECVTQIKNDNDNKLEAEYKRFSKRFPSLISGCGLIQAVAFAKVKAPKRFLAHLADVMGQGNEEILADHARNNPVNEYQHLTREALTASSWIKRYAEAILKD